MIQTPLKKDGAPTSPNAERISRAATRLILTHGARKVTMAEIAGAAGVGKGTAYQYWASKDDLVLHLTVQAAVAALESMIATIEVEPEDITVGRIMRLIVQSAAERPLVARVLHRNDDYLLTLIAERSWSEQAFAACSPPALCAALLPILRSHGLVRTDADQDDQTFAAVSMILGFFTTMTTSDPLTVNHVNDPGRVFEESTQSVFAALGRRPPRAARVTASEDIVRKLTQIRRDLTDEMN